VRENSDGRHRSCAIFIKLRAAVFTDAVYKHTENVKGAVAMTCFFE
jgi:hypothetical protein